MHRAFSICQKSFIKESARHCLLICLVLLSMAAYPLSAQGASQQLQIKYSEGLLTMTVKNTDIKEFFRELSQKTDIHIEYPADMEKNITLNKKGVAVKEFLTNFLRNMNYALILSLTDSGKKKVTDLYVYPESTASSQSNSVTQRIESRIAAYKRNIEKAKEKLQEVGEDSSRGKTYLNRISRYEKRIEELEKQL